MKPRNIIGIDIDDILTYGKCLEKDELPNHKNIEMVNTLYLNPKNIIILYTSRDISLKFSTLDWLERYNVKFHDIIFNKPKFDYFVDNRLISLTKLLERITYEDL